MIDTSQHLDDKGGQATTWRSHPVDIRISLPFFRTRYYFTFVAGQERRRVERRRHERSVNPLLTVGNVMFSLGLFTLVSLAAMAALVMQSAIIE